MKEDEPGGKFKARTIEGRYTFNVSARGAVSLRQGRLEKDTRHPVSSRQRRLKKDKTRWIVQGKDD